MTKIYNFPTIQISKQLFHVPGGAQEGGFTTGSVRMLSPEPGGRSVLEIQPSLQSGEWDYPMSSWLMSKGNGDVFRVRLAPTPQILGARNPGVPWDDDLLWSNQAEWAGDISAVFSAVTLEGATTVSINMSGYGNILKVGHLIGHRNSTYIADEIEYDTETDVAVVTVKPPLRADVAVGDTCLFRPYFTGTIANIGSARTTYDAVNNGTIQMNTITLMESIE